ncbi:putative ankyrin-repeat protein [Stygiomarasmius scandens]|uniref:Ankyrin-repeat protein n=1 Tax=Marasmiellus scandens TaxID=2682957 RepID=A0ABR1K808_9AGAR
MKKMHLDQLGIRIQMKRSIDTALNMFKSSSSLSNIHSGSRQQLSASTNNLNAVSPPTSPTRSRGDFSPSPSEDGHFSPSPSPIDPNSRRPSLPQVLQPSYSTPSSRKPATLTKPRTPRRPRSAGTDAERPDADMSVSLGTGRGSAGRKLGSKYSLMNLFKKGQAGESGGGVPLERTMSQQTTNSVFIGPYSSRSPRNNSFVNDSGPLPKPGYRFGSSGTLSSSPSQSSHLLSNSRASPSTSSVNQSHPSSPPRPVIPLAVDLHNAMASQQYQHMHRDRSGSSGSSSRPEGSAPIPIPLRPNHSYDEGGSSGSSVPLSTSPLTRKIAQLTQPIHSRDRSGSGASLNRNASVFEDDVVLSSGEHSLPGSRASSRPGILRAHNRTSSTGQSSGLRALRFDSASSTTSATRNADVIPPLRGCTSAGSLNRFHQRERRGSSRSPSRMRPSEVPTSETPDTRHLGHSAPATVTDFDTSPRNPEEEEDDASIYGHPLPIEQSTLVPNTQVRNRGASFASTVSSLSPSLSATEPGDCSVNVNADFPFSINRPPPVPLEDSEGSISGSGSHLQVPSVSQVDNRLRGDSISSTSTVDSVQNPDLSASGTTSGSGGSMTATTPIGALEELPSMSLPDTDVSGLRPEDGVAIVSINERRSHSPLPQINLDVVQSHAQAEALVQQKKQDILLAHSDGSGQAATVGYTPLSARLLALGESLELERELRKKKIEEESRSKIESVGRSSKVSEPDERESPTERNRPKRRKEPKRPHTSGGTSTAGGSADSTPNISVERVRPTHHSSLSASAVECSPTLDSEYNAPAIVNSRSFNEATYIRPLRARTPDLGKTLSRVSSFEGLHDGHDTDTDLGPALFRVSTAPHTASKVPRGRNQGSNTKLTRMGFTVNDPSAGRIPPPPKRFGGLRSLVQTLKGRQ